MSIMNSNREARLILTIENVRLTTELLIIQQFQNISPTIIPITQYH